MALAAGPVHGEGTLPDSLVYLRDIDPTIVQDIRYASANNFVGRPLDDQLRLECLYGYSTMGNPEIAERKHEFFDKRDEDRVTTRPTEC